MRTNVVPQGEAHVVERARQPYDVKGPGYWVVRARALDAICGRDRQSEQLWFRAARLFVPGRRRRGRRRRRTVCSP